jgi:hypothetical protein
MYHIIASQRWIFYDTGPRGYGCTRVAPIVRDWAHAEDLREVFIPLLLVENGVPVSSSPVFLVEDEIGGNGSVCFTEEVAKEGAQMSRWSKVYRAMFYPPIMSPHQFKIVKQGDEIIAVPDKNDDDSCLLFFGGDSWSRVEGTTTTGLVLKTAIIDKNLFGIAILEPGQVVSIYRGEIHAFVAHCWDGHRLKINKAKTYESHKRFYCSFVASVKR